MIVNLAEFRHQLQTLVAELQFQRYLKAFEQVPLHRDPVKNVNEWHPLLLLVGSHLARKAVPVPGADP